MEFVRKLPAEYSGYSEAFIHVARKQTDRTGHFSVLVASIDNYYYLPYDGLLVHAENYEDIRRLLPLHIYSGWAEGKLDLDKWEIRRWRGDVYSAFPKEMWP